MSALSTAPACAGNRSFMAPPWRSTSHRGVAAVDQVVTPGYERRFVREEEADQRRHFLRSAEPTQGMTLRQSGADLDRQAREERSIDVGRSDAVDPQSQRPVLRGRVLG